MKHFDILNDSRTTFDERDIFIQNKRHHYAATEYALICRYIDGETTLIPDKDFSASNLNLIKKLNAKYSMEG